MRDFNRFSKILWRFWPCFFALRHLDTSERDFIGKQPKKFLGKGSRTARKGKERVGLKLNGKGSGKMLPERIHTGEQSPFFRRGVLPDAAEKERAAGPKKNFGEGASIKIFRRPAGQGGAEAFQISEKIPAADGGGGRRGPPKNPRAEGAKSARSGGKRGGKPAPRKGPPGARAARKF